MTTIKYKMDNKKEIDFIKPYLNGQTNLHILDIGFGNGYFLSSIINAMRTKLSKVVGVDNLSIEIMEIEEVDFIRNHNNTLGNKQIDENVVEIIN